MHLNFKILKSQEEIVNSCRHIYVSLSELTYLESVEILRLQLLTIYVQSIHVADEQSQDSIECSCLPQCLNDCISCFMSFCSVGLYDSCHHVTFTKEGFF